MTALNDAASAAALAAGAHAATDVTGFGLLGHLHNLARESGLAAEVDAAAVPFIDGVDDLLARRDAVSGGSRRNGEYADDFTTYADDVPGLAPPPRADATTSGGLLVAVDPERADSVPGAVVGRLVAGDAGSDHGALSAGRGRPR